MILRCLAGLLLLLAPVMAAAQAPVANPRITASANGIRNEEHTRDLVLRRFDVAIVLHGAVAETVVTAAFDNDGKEILEGDFALQLPPDAVITGYALDIEGRMIDGVLVDRPRAKAVYEERVRQRIDPGLAEIADDGAFRTRVFPIPPGGGRTLRVRFTSIVGARGYLLSVRLDAPRTSWSIAVRATGLAAAPRIMLPGRGEQVTSSGEGFVASAEGKGGLSGVIEIASPTLPDAVASRHRTGETYVQLAGAIATKSSVERGGRVRIYWDRSRSRLKDRHDAELTVLRATLQALRPAAIEVVTFNSSGAERHSVATADAAMAMLRAVRYRGASSFAAVARDVAPADRCLLFSAGTPAIDRAARFAPRCRLDTVTTSPNADMDWLRHLAAAHGGGAFALGSEGAALAKTLAAGTSGVTSVIDDTGKPLAFVPVERGPGEWAVIAAAPATGAVRVWIGAVEVRRAIPRAAAFDGEGALIAASTRATLGATDRRGDYVALSRRYGIASENLSFLVLETPQDYVAADVTPPRDYPSEQRSAYLQLRKAADSYAAEQRRSHLDEVVDRWEEQVEWWQTRFRPNARPKQGTRERDEDRAIELPPPPPPPSSSPNSIATIPPPAVAESAAMESSGGDIVVTSTRVGPPSRPGAVIEIDAWQPDRTYLKAYDAAPARFDARFVREEKAGGDVPAFYLDTADWLKRRGQTAAATEMVLSALDLPSANEVTLGIVADRLERYGAFDRAVELRERQAVLDPDRPQPKRLLALALARRAKARPATARADLQRAVDLLSEVALTPWNDNWDGIEMIALMEANALIPRLRRAGGRVDLDRRLIALLDLDVRVVIEWTTDATDIDLWVDEPNRERAKFSNQRTAIGGHLSNDMTNGYGPEEYMLRRAIPGTYTVQADVYAPDAIDPNGLSLMTAHLIRDFGRPTEREESVDIELQRDEDGERLIGRIVVPRKAR